MDDNETEQVYEDITSAGKEKNAYWVVIEELEHALSQMKADQVLGKDGILKKMLELVGFATLHSMNILSLKWENP